MNANQLRASILQMAIDGKLVPQLDSEPAVEQLGNAPEDVPFEIPEKWKWVGFDHLLNIISGTSYKKHCITNSINDIRIIRGGNLRNNTISLLSDDIFVSQDLFDETKIVKNTDIVIVASTGSSTVIGRTAVYQGDELFQIGAFLRILRPKNTEYFDYLKFVFFSNYFSEYIRKKAKGTSINNLQKGYFTSFLIPLPPLEEQKRIVAKLEQLLPLVDEYGKAYEKLEELNAEFPDKLKASVLQSAIKGQLVPQLDSEPAVEQIGKAPEDVPFNIPEKWKWLQLNLLAEYVQRGKSPTYSDIESIPVISQKCNQWDGFHIEPAKFINPDTLSKYKKERFVQDNDLLWNSTGLGTIGRVALYKSELNPYKIAVVDSHVTIVRPNQQLLNPLFLYYYLSSATVQNSIEDLATGSTKQKELGLTTIKAYLTPLPPLEEQKRIVAKVEELFALIDAMKK